MHQSVVAFDVEGFSDPYRDDNAQAAVRAGVYQVVEESFAAAGIPWDLCVHEDRGDGAIVVVPPDISKVLLLDPLLGSLSAALTGYNRAARLAERIRLRLAVHAGEVAMDQHGLSGTDLVVACRLLDAEELRAALRHSPVPLAAIVSDGIYEGIVRHRYRNIEPANYHPVSVRVKRTQLNAWIHLPGTTSPPVIDSRPEGPEYDSPHQLRPDVATFVNRDRELKELDSAGQSGGLVVLVGPPGVGKTASALRWAHRIQGEYDGGQLYADLGGTARPVPLAEVFGRFLRALGVAPQRVPIDPDEQATMFRSLTAGRRLLMLLDNAASADQVRTLLPASPSSTTVTTSRAQLGELIAEGARFVQVGRLEALDGVELLVRTVGAARIKAESAAAGELVALCGGLPIALCVAAARLVSRPKWTVRKVVADLLDEQRRLARLSFSDDLSVKAVFDVSYQALSHPRPGSTGCWACIPGRISTPGWPPRYSRRHEPRRNNSSTSWSPRVCSKKWPRTGADSAISSAWTRMTALSKRNRQLNGRCACAECWTGISPVPRRPAGSSPRTAGTCGATSNMFPSTRSCSPVTTKHSTGLTVNASTCSPPPVPRSSRDCRP
jgi:hypothetical protein